MESEITKQGISNKEDNNEKGIKIGYDFIKSVKKLEQEIKDLKSADLSKLNEFEIAEFNTRLHLLYKNLTFQQKILQTLIATYPIMEIYNSKLRCE
jgi:hypothetical protein